MFSLGMIVGALFIFVCSIYDRKKIISEYEKKLIPVNAEDVCEKLSILEKDRKICTKAPDISPVTAEHLNALYVLDSKVSSAINEAKEARLPVGLLVSILHAHSTTETIAMINIE
jgi:hypothetical protein